MLRPSSSFSLILLLLLLHESSTTFLLCRAFTSSSYPTKQSSSIIASVPGSSSTHRLSMMEEASSSSSSLSAAAVASSEEGNPSSNIQADTSTTTTTTTDDHEKAFKLYTQQLCTQRNLPFEKIKNARDLASVPTSPIVPNRVYRTGRVSDATLSDIQLLFNDRSMNIKTFVDLRSPTELKDDTSLHRNELFHDVTDMVFYENGRMVRELKSGEYHMSKGTTTRRKRDQVRMAVGGAIDGTKDVLLGFVDNFFGKDDTNGDTNSDDGNNNNNSDDDDDDEDCIDDCIEASMLLKEQRYRNNRKERHFVSIMNELKYVRGTLSKLRKRDIAKTILKSPSTLVSKSARESIKKPFLDEINGGGLPMLNDLLLRYGAPGIKYVLDLCSDTNRHPVAFYCTAGKDRTGMIAAIILALLGTDDASIVEDYSLSANVYAEMDDHKAMVGALSQRSLDAKTFLGAPPQVMVDTLHNIRNEYGSVEEYLDVIGFGKESRDRLIRALTQ